jgi:hypothetical protein
MMVADHVVDGTERCAPGGAVGAQKTIERITCPCERQSLLDKIQERYIID